MIPIVPARSGDASSRTRRLADDVTAAGAASFGSRTSASTRRGSADDIRLGWAADHLQNRTLCTAMRTVMSPPESGIPVPSFLVGLDDEGHWAAVEIHGLRGGLFVSRQAAEDFAEFETGHRPGAVLIAEGRIRLPFAQQ